MSELTEFQGEIKNILEEARGKARSAVNAAMVEAYWFILYTLCRDLSWSHTRPISPVGLWKTRPVAGGACNG